MPYTSYTSYNYSNYGVNNRPYTGSKTYTAFGSSSPYGTSSSSSSAYSLAPSATTSYVPRYRLGSSDLGSTSSALSSSPYGLKSSTSTASLSNYDTGGLTAKKVSAAPTFLSGNTASLRKAFGDSEPTPANTSGLPPPYRVKRFDADGDKKPADRIYFPPKTFNKVDTPNYLSKYGLFDSQKPKEIESSQINVINKPPPRPATEGGDIRRQDPGTISRNRQVVRLTIKRNKGTNDSYDVRKNSIKTVAQRLLDKYTISEKKPNSEPLHYGPRDRQYISSVSESDKRKIGSDREDSDDNEELGTISSKGRESSINLDKETAKFISGSASKEIGSQRRPSQPGAELEDSAVVFSRATESATQKLDLENEQEIKDIILTAALHPDIDIESDEEIKRLIEADSGGESLPNTPEISVNMSKKASGRKINPFEALAKRRDSGDTSLSDGSMIVDKLKRFVKQQVSIKKASVKRLSKTGSKKSSDAPAVISVKLKGVKDFNSKKNLASQDQQQRNNAIEAEGETESNRPRKDSDLLSLPRDQTREFDRLFKKSPTPQLALMEGMEKIKMSIAVCDSICKNKDDVDGSSGRNSLSSHSSASLDSSKSSNSLNSSTAVVGSLTLGLQIGDLTSTCLEDAPWRKKRSPYINKSKTSVNLLSSQKSSNSSTFPNSSQALSKSSSSFTIDQSVNNLNNRIANFPEGNSTVVSNILDNHENETPSTLSGSPKSRIIEFKESLQNVMHTNFAPIISVCSSESNEDTRENRLNNITKSSDDHKTNKFDLLKYSFDPIDSTKQQHKITSQVDDKFVPQNLTELGRPTSSGDDRHKKKCSPRSNKNPEQLKSMSTDKKTEKSSKSSPCSSRSSKPKLKRPSPNNSMEVSDNRVIELEVGNEDGKLKKWSGINKKLEVSGKALGNAARDECCSGNRTTEEAVSSTGSCKIGISSLSNDGIISPKRKSNKSKETSKILPRDEIRNGREDTSTEKTEEKSCLMNGKEADINHDLQSEKVKQSLVPVTKETKPFDELLNARNVLKKPLRDKDNLNLNTKVETNKVPETNLKKVWKKPISTIDTNAKPFDEIKQLRNVLKRPVKTNLGGVGAKPAENKLTVAKNIPIAGTSNQEVLKPKKLWKKTRIPRKSSNGNKNLDSDSEGEEDSTVKRQKPKRISPKASKLSSSGTQLSPKSETEIPSKKTSSETFFDLQSASGGHPKGGSPRQSSSSKPRRAPKPSPSEPTNDSLPSSSPATKKKTAAGEAATTENLIGLCASKSADSAYGSSPSTPQPNSALQLVSSSSGDPPSSTSALLLNSTAKNDHKNSSADKLCLGEEAACQLCGTNCHRKCERQVPNLCGVNQKLLAEALSSVKKGSTTEARENKLNASSSSGTTSSTTTTTTSDDDDSTTTETDSEFNGPAEIRAPLKSRPKYRKYNVEDFNFIKVLGKGSFGKVMLAQQVGTENYFAVKCLKKDVVLEDNDVECTLIERKVLTLGTKHPYLCHLFCSFQTASHLFFVMEYLTGGDLMFHIQHSGRFDEYRACFYASEICSGLRFLHNKGIIYRDLKLDNILLDYEGHIRIADFGMCKLQIYLDKFADTFCGTPDYMAPEVIKGLHYNQCVDWWSFGVLLYEMIVGKSPFKGCDEDHLFWLICNEEPFYPKFLTIQAQSILKQLLDKDSTKRLGIPYSPYGDIQCHPFFKYVDWSKIESKTVETPYKPRLRHILDVQYFDRLFTRRNAALTPIEDSILTTMDQTPFKDFSYTNPNITD